jgi:uncharacterized membrane protein
VIEYLRLVFGTVLVLLPGAAVARALGQRSVSAVVAWTLASVFVAWAVVFVVHSNIKLAALVLLAILTASTVAAKRKGIREQGQRMSAAPLLIGITLGWLLWHVAGAVVGDGLFHEARVRKLVALGDLHLRTVDEFRDGGLHPGYAFPLWHGLLALVSWLSGVGAGGVIRHEPSVLAPLACAVAWEAGVAVFRSRWAGASVLLAQLALFCFAPGHGGSYAQLAQPATASRQLLVPAAIALFFGAPTLPAQLALAAVFGALGLIHPTYAVFLLLPFVAFAALRPREWRDWWAALAAAAGPLLLTLLWLRPIVDETRSHNPDRAERLRALAHYGSQLVVRDDRHYRLAAGVVARSGAVAVAALLLLPLAALAWRRRWAAFSLGGAVLILALMEVPWLFVHLSDAVSLSQSRRAAGFVPITFALVGTAALVARRAVVLPAALAAGIVLQRLWPGDFGSGLHHGGPGLATWIALVGGAAAAIVAVLLRPQPRAEHHALAAAAMLLFVAPVVVHGLWHWSPRVPVDPGALSPRLEHNLRARVPKGAIVIAPIETSYRVVAVAPVYVVAIPAAHVADTVSNDPYTRARAVRHWTRTDDPRVARRYGATWAIRSGRLYRLSR